MKSYSHGIVPKRKKTQHFTCFYIPIYSKVHKTRRLNAIQKYLAKQNFNK